jgi:hypothetical protein
VGARLFFGDAGMALAVDESELVEQELVEHWPLYGSFESEQGGNSAGLSIRPKYLILAWTTLHLIGLCVTLRDDRAVDLANGDRQHQQICNWRHEHWRSILPHIALRESSCVFRALKDHNDRGYHAD